jgi:hypothetical protein
MIPARRRAMPSPWAMLFLAVCCLLSMIITYRAGAQNAGTAAPPAAETKPAADKPADKPAADKPADKTDAPAAPANSKRPPPSKAEESATIQDDPTLVPDDKESADNNVTFPVDI